MRTHVNIYITVVMTLAALAMTPSVSTAQEYANTPVQISKEKVRINGEVCYSHIVLEKQTLFSISKAYEVSIEDIYRFNPTLKETGLKKNSIIIIPSKEALKSQQKAEAVPEDTGKEQVKEDKAQDRQVKGKEEKEKKETAAKSRSKTTKAKRIHIARWYEDLDVIAAHYGVSVEDIMKANNLKGRKLSRRQKLVIPYPDESLNENVETEVQETVAEASEETFDKADSTAVSETVPEQAPADAKVNMTLMLPLTNTEGEPSRNNSDFYCGALLAIYDMAEKGISCNLNVYDIMDKKTPFSSDAIKDSDVVIGPVSEADLTRLMYSAPGADAVVSPLDPRAEKLVKEHSAIIQAPTPHAIQYKDLVKWMEEDFKDGDLAVMITEKGARQSSITSQFREALDSSSFAYNTFSYSILEGRDVTKPLTELMTAEGSNRILIASESEAFVNDVVRNLNLLIYNNLDIVLYAPSKIRSFETIEVENFHNTSMRVSLGYHIDYDAPEVKAFLKKYRALYNTEPTQFAFQGYDIARYFLELCAKYGNSWKEHLADSPAAMLQSTFDFARQTSGGHTNNGVRRIIYEKGYGIRKVR